MLTRKSGRFLSGLASGLVAIAFVSGGAYAISDTVFKYSSPQTGWYTIDRMAMVPDGDASAGDYLNSWGGSLVSNGGAPCFNTGVNLPHGATITGLAVWYQNSPGTSPTVFLYRHKVSDNVQNTIGTQNLTDTSNTRVAESVPINASFAAVNNQAYSYGLGLCLTATARFYAARITYTYKTAGD